MRKRISRRLYVENLENRRLLAGDVTVERSGADLYVTGDSLPNTISIESDGSGGVRVIGFNDQFGQPTSINGTPNGSYRSTNFSGNLFVNMNDGDDQVRLTRLQVQTAVLNLGAGNDELIAGLQSSTETRFGTTAPLRLTVNHDLVVVGGSGDDSVRLQSVYIAGSSTIDTGDHNDTITLLPGVDGPSLAQTAQRIDVGGTLSIVPGTGSDVVSAKAVITGANLIIDDATGPLTANLTSFRSNGSTLIYATPDNDQINLKEGRAEALLQIISEGGDDILSVVNMYADHVVLNAGDGNDRLTLNNVRGPRADVQMAAGDDRVIMRQLDIDTLFAFGNLGNDFFDVRSSKVGQANFYGEDGYDTFQTSLLEPNTFGELNLYTFERRLQV
jgi:hypothetical protein